MTLIRYFFTLCASVPLWLKTQFLHRRLKLAQSEHDRLALELSGELFAAVEPTALSRLGMRKLQQLERKTRDNKITHLGARVVPRSLVESELLRRRVLSNTWREPTSVPVVSR